MRRTILLAFFFAAKTACAVDFAHSIPADCEQVALVVAPEWSSTTGTLQRFGRSTAHGSWQAIGTPMPVLLGKRGLAWGIGLHPAVQDGAPRKTEGDLRSPAGVFGLGPVFGRKPRDAMPWIRMPYQPLSPTVEAIDDPASHFYDHLVDRAHIAQPDWRTSERMWPAAAYELGVIIAHNPDHHPGAGSCIFLHLWLGERQGTSGCTALHRADLIELLRWLDPVLHPVLVQLPEGTARQDLRGF